MRARRLLLLASLTAAAAVPAWAQGAKTASTDGGGLALPVALFVQEPATGYGMYKARASQAFKDGEPLLFYLEPAGFAYEKEGEMTRFGALVDLRIKEGDNTVFTKDGFLDARFLSHHQNREINFSGRLDVKGAPKGSYRLELVAKDAVSGKAATVELPFTIE